VGTCFIGSPFYLPHYSDYPATKTLQCTSPRHSTSLLIIVDELARARVDGGDEEEDDGGHDRFAHYIKKEKIVESAVTGKSVRALCGKKWVPSRDPQKYPICPICKEIYEGLRES